MLNELYKVIYESKNTNNSSWTDVEYKNIHTNLKELILFLKKYINVLNEHAKWEGSTEILKYQEALQLLLRYYKEKR